MKKNLFKSLNLVLFLILFFAQPLSISAAIFQKQTSNAISKSEIKTELFKNKTSVNTLKMNPIKRFLLKKILKRGFNPDFDQPKKSNVISLLSVFFGGLGLILTFASVSTAALGLILGSIGFILGILGFFIEDAFTLSGLGALMGFFCFVLLITVIKVL